MKRCIQMIIVAVMAGFSASALPLEWWEMNDAAGTDLNDLSNSGTLGSVWNFNTAGHETDGNGLFVIAGDAGVGSTTRKLPKKGTANADASNDLYASPITNGAYSLTVDFAAWSLDAGSLGDLWKLKAQNSAGVDIAGIEFGMDTTNSVRIRMWNLESDGSAYRSYSFNVSSPSGAVAEVHFDFDNDTVSYVLDGVEEYSDTDFIGTELAGIIYTTSGDGTADWSTAASSFSIDAMGLDDLSGSVDPVVILGRAGGTLANDLTNAQTIATFTAEAGDVLVFGAVGSNNNHIQPAAIDWASSDGGAVDVTVLTNKASAAMWYTTVTTAGTFSVDFLPTNNYTSVGAYQIRAQDPENLLLDIQAVYVSGDISNTVADLAYSIAADSAVALVEVCGTTSAGVTANDGVTIDYVNDPPRRVVGSGTYTNLSTLATSWTTDQSTAGYIAVVGLAAYLQSTSAPPATPQSMFDTWAATNITGSATNLLDDADGDSLDNLTEYAIGGNPDSAADQGNVPLKSMTELNGTNYLVYVYYERDDAAARGLSASLTAGTDLVNTNWSASPIEFVGSGAGPAGFNAVTNRVPMDQPQGFLRLQVEFTP